MRVTFIVLFVLPSTPIWRWGAKSQLCQKILKITSSLVLSCSRLVNIVMVLSNQDTRLLDKIIFNHSEPRLLVSKFCNYCCGFSKTIILRRAVSVVVESSSLKSRYSSVLAEAQGVYRTTNISYARINPR